MVFRESSILTQSDACIWNRHCVVAASYTSHSTTTLTSGYLAYKIVTFCTPGVCINWSKIVFVEEILTIFVFHAVVGVDQTRICAARLMIPKDSVRRRNSHNFCLPCGRGCRPDTYLCSSAADSQVCSTFVKTSHCTLICNSPSAGLILCTTSRCTSKCGKSRSAERWICSVTFKNLLTDFFNFY